MSEIVAEVKYRRPLNEQQIKTLHALYWYRFCTSKQLAAHLKKPNPKAIQNKLKVLEDQGFIDKRYDKSYKLAGRSAEYFITPKGARELEKVKPKTTNKWAMKSLYKNKTVSQEFLAHCITVTDVAMKLLQLHGDGKKIHALPRSYMAAFSTYPEWTPDLHLEFMEGGVEKNYFLDIWDGSKPFFVTVRKTRNYVNFSETSDWDDDDDFPVILAVCSDAYTQKKLNRQMKHILYNDWDGDHMFATTTLKQLTDAEKPTEKIWMRINPDDEPELIRLPIVVEE